MVVARFMVLMLTPNNSCSKQVNVQSILLRTGGSRNSGKGVHMFKGVGVRFADFISFFLKYP